MMDDVMQMEIVASAAVTAALGLAARKAADGVDYSARIGASCPWCRRKVQIYRTMPWEGRCRIRYHRCGHPGCVLAVLGVSIKSVEEDVVGRCED